MNPAALTIPGSCWSETTSLDFHCSPSVLQGKVLGFFVLKPADVLGLVLRLDPGTCPGVCGCSAGSDLCDGRAWIH